MNETKIKTDAEIWINNVRLKAHGTGFTLQVTSDPEQHNVKLYFNPESAESVKEAIERYIQMRDTLSKLTQ